MVFAESQDCGNITQENREYKLTGNYYGCTWYNMNCNFDGACHVCSGGQGTCPWYDADPYWTNDYHDGDNNGDYGYEWDCEGEWWNRAPSVGANGNHCMAYTVPPPTISYVYGPNSLLARKDNNNNQTYYYHKEGDSVVRITNQSGAVVKLQEYYPYGEILSVSGSLNDSFGWGELDL